MLVTWRNKWTTVNSLRLRIPIKQVVREISLNEPQQVHKPEMLETKKSRLPGNDCRRGTKAFASLADPKALILIISSYVAMLVCS